MRRPIGSWSGQKRCASVSSTMISACGRRRASSRSSKNRPRDQLRAHRLEVARRDVDRAGRDHRLARLHLIALGEDDAVVVVAAERNRVGGAGGRHAGQRAQAPQRLVGERATAPSSSAYRERGRLTDAVSTPSGLKPGSTASTWRKLANSRPAPISSTNANATCATTSARRSVRAPRPPVPLRPFFAQHDRRDCAGSTLRDRNQPEHEADHARRRQACTRRRRRRGGSRCPRGRSWMFSVPSSRSAA